MRRNNGDGGGTVDGRHDLRFLRGRVKKKLNKLGGVTATVNFARERAAVSIPDSVSPGDLIAVVERTG